MKKKHTQKKTRKTVRLWQWSEPRTVAAQGDVEDGSRLAGHLEGEQVFTRMALVEAQQDHAWNPGNLYCRVRPTAILVLG